MLTYEEAKGIALIIFALLSGMGVFCFLADSSFRINLDTPEIEEEREEE